MTLDLTDRNSLIASLPHGGIIAEIGVASGDFSAIILDRCKPQLLVLVDCWEHQSETVYGNDPANHSQEVMDAEYESVMKRFADDPVQIIRAYSLDAAGMFPDKYFDAIYLDGNHLQARKDADAWYPKVKSGGYFMGHDFTVAGDYITTKRDITAWANDNGLTIQVAGLESDNVFERNYPSWCVRKE